MKSNNELADEFLERFKEAKTIRIDNYDDYIRVGWNLNIERRLITVNSGYSQEFTITPLGIKVLNVGGWENYIDTEVQADKSRKHHNKLALEKLRSDLNLVNTKLSYYGLTQFMSVVSFIIAIVLAILKIAE
ncbi:hypothetical protein [Psychroserpens luteolus]|uniref:hypothetical protein n=1 Tax=Psychroserpens luteolus TaxID=2855840 RepID=UPI001E4AE733|nr:hypothetical protein [Psychroserpens luteolus]MCD2260391.1 hypothetical protein [Psychroserpens luteolus]